MSGISYQQLDRYKGSLYGAIRYGGLEYDREVMDNQVIGSPGGVSATHHHYTKGMYSPEVSYSDIYGGETPAYPYAEFGNLYQVGQAAPYYMGDFQQPREPMFTQNGSLMRRDNFVPGVENQGKGPAVELIPPPDSTAIVDPVTGEMLTNEQIRARNTLSAAEKSELDAAVTLAEHKLKNLITVPNPLALFVLLFLLWMTFDFAMYGFEGFIVAKFHSGQPLNWKWYTFYAVAFGILLVIAAKFINISIINLEGVKSSN
jgi:hypothetical protein